MKILGVDPGINGAIALYEGGANEVLVRDIPTLKSKGRGKEVNEAALADDFDLFFSTADHAFIEKVGARPHEGRGSVFKFGYAAGIVRGMVMMCRIPVTPATPTKWKLDMGLTSDKDYSRTRATELFPASAAEFRLKKDNNKAEAALIAYYGWLQLTRSKA